MAKWWATAAIGLCWVQLVFGGNPDSLRSALEQDLPLPARAGLQFELAESYLTTNLFQCLHFAQATYETAAQIPDTNYMAQAHNLQALAYQYRGAQESAMKHYLLALDLAVKSNDTNGIAALSTNLGSLYYEAGKPEKAHEHFTTALNIYSSKNDTASIAQGQLNLANALSELGKQDKSLELYLSAAQLATAAGDREQLCYVNINLAEHHIEQGDYALGIELLSNGLHTLPKAGWWERCHGWSALGSAFLEWDRLDSAHYYAHLAHDAALRDGFIPEIKASAELLYRVFDGWHQTDSALHYYRVFKAYEDSLDLDNAQNAIELLETQYALKQSEAENARQAEALRAIRAEEALARVQRNTLMVLLALLALTTIPVVFWLRSRKRLVTAEKELLSVKVEQEQNERQLLQNELEFLNQSLISYSVLLAQKNALLNDLKEKLAADDATRALVTSINAGQAFEDEWEQFKVVFERVHPTFFARLKEQFPELTANEVRLCALLKLDMSSKQIGALLNIEPRSVDKNRYRVRKKLGLTAEDNLTAFVATL